MIAERNKAVFTQPPESRIKSRENHDSGTVEITIQESRKSQTSNTDSNNTDSHSWKWRFAGCCGRKCKVSAVLVYYK